MELGEGQSVVDRHGVWGSVGRRRRGRSGHRWDGRLPAEVEVAGQMAPGRGAARNRADLVLTRPRVRGQVTCS